ncbi:17451_t:CDS:1 [Cetraspora pellucida]|uniref:17451_t:CDS:1 n=1 Tax=Cetraspora pellucida TaxID=1433469 RepID=A0ACA9N7I7_9GLOM|nr:17451_t:CDS:1 [Cetraspora pellucida]
MKSLFNRNANQNNDIFKDIEKQVDKIVANELRKSTYNEESDSTQCDELVDDHNDEYIPEEETADEIVNEIKKKPKKNNNRKVKKLTEKQKRHQEFIDLLNEATEFQNWPSDTKRPKKKNKIQSDSNLKKSEKVNINNEDCSNSEMFNEIIEKEKEFTKDNDDNLMINIEEVQDKIYVSDQDKNNYNRNISKRIKIKNPGKFEYNGMVFDDSSEVEIIEYN